MAKVIKFQYINKLEELVILSIAKDLARKREYSNPLDSRFLVQTRNDNKLNSTLLNTHYSLLLTIFTSLSRRVVFAIYTTSQATRLSGDVKKNYKERKGVIAAPRIPGKPPVVVSHRRSAFLRQVSEPYDVRRSAFGLDVPRPKAGNVPAYNNQAWEE